MEKIENSHQGELGSTPRGLKQGTVRPQPRLQDALRRRRQTETSLESQTIRDVEKWVEIYAKDGNAKYPHGEEICNMLLSFHEFCQVYLAELSKYAPITSRTWLENTVDNILLVYWDPLLRTAEQQRSDHYQIFFEEADKKLSELKTALVNRLNFPMDEVHIVLYFEKMSNAKRFPFGSTYLIGIPLIDAYRDDWMAIPHELGHYIFWNAHSSSKRTNFLRNEIDGAMQNLKMDEKNKARAAIKKIMRNWTEEIFADVVGARIAEKQFYEGAWQRILQRVETKDGLFLSDGEHPIPYLLPYLRASAAGLELGDRSFERRWKQHFGDVKDTRLGLDKSTERQGDLSIKIEDLRDVIQVYAKNITDRLQKTPIKKLIESPSPVDEWKKFVEDTKTELSNNKNSAHKKYTSQELQRDMLNLLLAPAILEKRETWTCPNPQCGQVNASNPCSRCGTRQPGSSSSSWPYKVVQDVVDAVNSIIHT